MIPNPKKRAMAEDENERVDFGVDHKVTNCSPFRCHRIAIWTATETSKFALPHFANCQTYTPFLSCPATTETSSYTSRNSRTIVRRWRRIATPSLLDTPLPFGTNQHGANTCSYCLHFSWWYRLRYWYGRLSTTNFPGSFEPAGSLIRQFPICILARVPAHFQWRKDPYATMGPFSVHRYKHWDDRCTGHGRKPLRHSFRAGLLPQAEKKASKSYQWRWEYAFLCQYDFSIGDDGGNDESPWCETWRQLLTHGGYSKSWESPSGGGCFDTDTYQGKTLDGLQSWLREMPGQGSRTL